MPDGTCRGKGVPPYIICSDKTLKICVPNVLWIPPRWQPCTEWVHRKSKVTVRVLHRLSQYFERAWWKNCHSEGIFRHDSRHHDSSPSKKKKTAVLYRSGKLDEVELTDTCMLSELTNRINALCEENDRKKLTASFINQLLVEKDILRKPCREKKR